jgi:DNA-binding MarR family transcriptional regulator
VQLTRKGRALLERTRPAYEEWLERVGGENVSDRDLAALSRAVNKLIEALDSESD